MRLPTTLLGAFLRELTAGKDAGPVDVFEPIRALHRERMASPATINITINIIPSQEEPQWPIQ